MDDQTPWWPVWKFGLKREDFFTTLHQQYNTFASAIQDREAFYHDVLEISTTAHDLGQFKDMLDQRRKLRLHELEEALTAIGPQVIGNPSVFSNNADETERWHHALRIFRWRSLDALVQYFASYLSSEPRSHQREECEGTHPDAHRAAQPRTPAQSPSRQVEICTASSTLSLPERQSQQQQSSPGKPLPSSLQAIPKPHVDPVRPISNPRSSKPPQLRMRRPTQEKSSEYHFDALGAAAG